VRGSMVGGGAVGGCAAGQRSDAATVGGRWGRRGGVSGVTTEPKDRLEGVKD
jgi:hypothetical protein